MCDGTHWKSGIGLFLIPLWLPKILNFIMPQFLLLKKTTKHPNSAAPPSKYVEKFNHL